MAETISKDSQQDIFDLVYQELRRIARSQRRALGAAATLQTTALVHEAYLKLYKAQPAQPMERMHFLSLAARAMRQILIDHARSRARLKRGGGDFAITGLHEEIGSAANLVDLVALDAALTRLTGLDERAAQLVEWRIFGGFDIAEIAALQGLTERTVFRDWRRARAFLVSELALDDVS